MKKIWIVGILLLAAAIGYLAPELAVKLEGKLGIQELEKHEKKHANKMDRADGINLRLDIGGFAYDT